MASLGLILPVFRMKRFTESGVSNPGFPLGSSEECEAGRVSPAADNSSDGSRSEAGPEVCCSATPKPALGTHQLWLCLLHPHHGGSLVPSGGGRTEEEAQCRGHQGLGSMGCTGCDGSLPGGSLLARAGVALSCSPLSAQVPGQHPPASRGGEVPEDQASEQGVPGEGCHQSDLAWGGRRGRACEATQDPGWRWEQLGCSQPVAARASCRKAPAGLGS